MQVVGRVQLAQGGERIARAGLGLESPSYGRWTSDDAKNTCTPADSRPGLAGSLITLLPVRPVVGRVLLTQGRG